MLTHSIGHLAPLPTRYPRAKRRLRPHQHRHKALSRGLGCLLHARSRSATCGSPRLHKETKQITKQCVAVHGAAGKAGEFNSNRYETRWEARDRHVRPRRSTGRSSSRKTKTLTLSDRSIGLKRSTKINPLFFLFIIVKNPISIFQQKRLNQPILLVDVTLRR